MFLREYLITEPSTITVKLSPSGRWTVSMLVDVEIERLSESLNLVGVDLGITSLVPQGGSQKSKVKSIMEWAF
ncbi:MAG: hypothetical protein ACYTXC_03900 [Nostoc sp.]